MKALLIFPPVADPAHPPLGIASIASFLKVRDEPVRCLDLNIDSYYYFLSKENLQRSAEQIGKRISRLEALDSLTDDQAQEYSFISECYMGSEYLVQSINEALADVREKAIYRDRDKYQKVSFVIRRAMDLASAPFYPTQWTIHGFSMRFPSSHSEYVLSAIRNQQENMYIPYFKTCIPEIKKMRLSVIGLSLNYYSQVIPCMTLAHELKKHCGNISIVVGGSLIGFFKDRWNDLKPFRSFVDVFVPYEGEKPFLNIVRARKEGKLWNSVPGVVYFNNKTAVFNASDHRNDITKAAVPDYDDFNLHGYLSPRPILPYSIAKSCYWGKCTFCSYHLYYPGQYSCKPAGQVVKDLDALAARYQANDFFFVDDAIPPSTAHAVSGHVRENKLPYTWYGEMRLEPVLTAKLLKDFYRGGCRLLLFGLESGVQRVLRKMNKGTNPSSNAKILRNCARAGINTFVMFMIGFPTETKKEAEQTRTFIEDNSASITHVGFGNFVVIKNTYIYNNPSEFSIRGLNKFRNADLTLFVDHEVAAGLTRSEAVRFVQDLQKNWNIHSLYNFPLLSRSHLSFLPHKERTVKNRTQAVTPTALKRVYPRVARSVISIETHFDLEKIRSRIQSSQHPRRFKKEQTHYLYDPATTKLIAIDQQGLFLLELCDGKNSIKDILQLSNKKGRQIILDFYRNLYTARFLV